MLVSKLIGSGVDNTYAKLIPLLEGIHVVNWAFQTFDMESTCKINYKFEGPNRLFLDVNVLPLGNFNLEFKKCMHEVDLDFASNSQQTRECIIKETQIQDWTPLEDFDQPLPPPPSFRVSGESIDTCGISREVHIGDCCSYG